MAPRRRRPQRVPRGPVDPNRFAAGWRLLRDRDLVVELGGIELEPRPQNEQPDLVVDITRARDLVSLTVECYGCELVTGGDGPVVRPTADAAGRLVVRFPFQHLGERAVYETPAPKPNESSPAGPPATGAAADTAANTDGPNTLIPWPLADHEAIPARGSRLVFSLPAGDSIPFSSDGFLAAIGRLPMLVHRLATPRPPGATGDEPRRRFVLPGGVMAEIGAGLVQITPAKAAEVKAVDTVAQFRNLRVARTAMVERTATITTAAERRVTSGATEIEIAGRATAVPPLFGTGGLTVRPDRVTIPRFTRAVLSEPPTAMQTAIEAPFRLVISPSDQGGWVHADAPVGAAGAEHRVELWHTRLGVRDTQGAVDERSPEQRIVRAIWTRDREAVPDWPATKVVAHQLTQPSRMSLDTGDRQMIVRQSAETWLGVRRAPISPIPVNADALWLSALGARLDLHGRWLSEPYSLNDMNSILRWDHLAPWGRDQHVVVVYPGYLFPFGFRCALVKVTERKTKSPANSVAGLYQRMFLVPGERRKVYDEIRLPYIDASIGPERSPTIESPTDAQLNSWFWPLIGGGQRMTWTIDGSDHEGRRVRTHPALIWVAEHFKHQDDINTAYVADAASDIDVFGQKVAYTPTKAGGDTMAPTARITLAGKTDGTGLRSTPYMRTATIDLQAVKALSAAAGVEVAYAQPYLDHGFGAGNAGEVWAELVNEVQMRFGEGQPTGSDKAGGFLQPDLPVRGLSRTAGTVGDVNGTASGQFDPSAYLAGAMPKLFGLVPLTELLSLVGLDKAPNVVSQAVDRIEGFLADLGRAQAAAAEAVADAQRLVDRAAGKAAGYVGQAQDALAAAEAMATEVTTVAGAISDAVLALPNATKDAVEAALLDPPDSLFGALRDALATIRATSPKLPPLIKHRLDDLAKILQAVVDAADIIDDIVRFLNGFDPSALQVQFRYEWRPVIHSWPTSDPLLIFKPEGPGDRDNLVLAVDGRASGKGELSVEVLAELRDFALLLLPGEPLVRFDFDHLSFKSGSTGKAEVDVVLNEIEFLGLLGFVETLKELIPFDGFSDPPYLDVSPAGITAGFSLALPNVAIGVFALSNISLGADVSVPFLGKAVTVGFNFCTRERPFTLQVTFIGGGGWFLIRLSPDGLDLLELGLEAGATLSVDFGVASGSISAMIGVYIRLEGDTGSLTAYFRLRGEVDVLGIISASIELYLELTYQFDTGKLHGLARLTIEIDVFIFSGSVTIECERTFAGSKGDPTFVEMMAVQPDGSSDPWSEYCAAFAAVEV